MVLSSPFLLPYLVPLAIVVLFTALQVALLLIGGISVGLEADADVDLDVDVDADVDLDVDVDADVDLDVDVDADVDLDADVDVDADGDADADLDADAHSPGIVLLKLLEPLGVGKVPLSVVGQAFGLSFGMAGLASSYALHAQLGELGALQLAITLPISFVAACLLTQRLVRLVLPFLRVSGQAESAQDLVGKRGRVTSLRVDGEFGEVVLTVNGAPSYVFVRSGGEPIDRDAEVVVVAYDRDLQRHVVQLAAPGRAGAPGEAAQAA
ncbi:MAG: hypothetical protein AB7N76_34195 [Planctomycetota bacterium]